MKSGVAAAFAVLAVLLASSGTRAETSNLPPGWQWPPSPAMLATGERCLAQLDALGVAYRRVDAGRRRIATPIVVPSMTFGPLRIASRARRSEWIMDCHLAKSLAQSAWLFRAAGITELRFSSIYSHRHARLGGRATRLLSRHALGLAIDLKAVIDQHGELYSVRRSYANTRSPWRRAIALLDASRLLRIVLSPDNERAHVDHVHISALMPILGATADAPIDHRTLASIADPKWQRRTKPRPRRGAREQHCRPRSRVRRSDGCS